MQACSLTLPTSEKPVLWHYQPQENLFFDTTNLRKTCSLTLTTSSKPVLWHYQPQATPISQNLSLIWMSRQSLGKWIETLSALVLPPLREKLNTFWWETLYSISRLYVKIWHNSHQWEYSYINEQVCICQKQKSVGLNILVFILYT